MGGGVGVKMGETGKIVYNSFSEFQGRECETTPCGEVEPYFYRCAIFGFLNTG